MHLFVGNGGRSIFVKRLVDEKRKDVKLKTYSDTKRAGLVLSMSQKKGLSVEDVVAKLASAKEEVPPLELTEELVPNRGIICKKCGSLDLVILTKGNRNKLVCNECLAYQKFLTKVDAKTFLELGGESRPA